MKKIDLKQIIKEELDKFLNEEEANLDAIADYLIADDIDQEDEMEELDEIQGRTSGGERRFKLKGDYTVEDVTSFLKKVQYKIANKKSKGRKPINFTDEDIQNFASLLTKKEGFNRRDILDSISFYKGKPFQIAQRLMDVLGEPKMINDFDKEGNRMTTGKGYITVIDKPSKEKKTKEYKIDVEDDLDAEEDFDSFEGSWDDLEPTEDYLNEQRILQKRAGLLKG
jgi:hypothetical protein